jgi:carbon monoxide dehydrogenase subunit G
VKLNNSFLVPASQDVAWETLLDVPAMVACMPGAELVDVVDDSTWKTNMKIKFGPIGMTFAADVTQEDADRSAGRVVLNAKAREVRGRGGAQASIVSTLSEVEDGTRVDISMDLLLSGPVAQYGRGLVEDVSSELVGQFAANLRQQLDATPGPEETPAATPSSPQASGPTGAATATAPAPPRAPAPASAAKPISGLRLGFLALRRAARRLVRRLGSRGGS